MSDLDLVFDFDGWKLNGVHIFSEPAAFAFLGKGETRTSKIVLQSGLLERFKAWFKGQNIGAKPEIIYDCTLIYRKFGLHFSYLNDKCVETIYIDSLFPGRFIFGTDPIELSGDSSPQNIKDIFGNPNEENTKLRVLDYVINDYKLNFYFNKQQKLDALMGSYWKPEDMKLQNDLNLEQADK
jgi:hypothetical protein